MAIRNVCRDLLVQGCVQNYQEIFAGMVRYVLLHDALCNRIGILHPISSNFHTEEIYVIISIGMFTFLVQCQWGSCMLDAFIDVFAGLSNSVCSGDTKKECEGSYKATTHWKGRHSVSGIVLRACSLWVKAAEECELGASQGTTNDGYDTETSVTCAVMCRFRIDSFDLLQNWTEVWAMAGTWSASKPKQRCGVIKVRHIISVNCKVCRYV